MIPKDLLVSFFSIAWITNMDMFYVDCREEIHVFLRKHYTLTDALAHFSQLTLIIQIKPQL